MTRRDSETEAASEPSDRSDCIGPCSSLLMIPRLSSSSTLRCFLFSSGPMALMALSTSPFRMASALARSFLIVGTVSRLSRHASNAHRSCSSSALASSAAARRASLLASTTSRRSSTLYAFTLGRDATSVATLRGTAMSNTRRTEPTAWDGGARPAMLAAVSSGSSLDEAVKMTSAWAAASRRSGDSRMVMLASGNSAARASALARLRLTRVMAVQPLDTRCLTSSRVILPAPTMQTRHPSKLPLGSFICASSAAAEETETAPDAMPVSVRTRFPAVIAALNRPFRWRPKPGAFSPEEWTALT